MKIYTWIIALLFTSAAISQEKYTVQKININSTLFADTKNEIPKVVALKKEYAAVANIINKQILEEYSLTGFQLNKDEEFRFSGCTFSYQINTTHLFLKIEGEYLGPYPSQFDNEYIFNLKNGALENNDNIPFQAFFTLNGYLDFMDNYWLNDIKKQFDISIKDCEGSEPYCTYYDIDKYEVQNNQLSISLTNDCYPHVVKVCTPYLTKSFSKEIMKKYLSEWGYRILFNANYVAYKGIEKFLINQKERDNAENNIFLFGKTNKLYPISMALQLSKKDNTVSGYYYYDKKKIKIKLSGTFTGNSISLNEYTNNQNTGSFSLKFEENYKPDGFSIYENDDKSKYLTGNWSNQKSQFKVIFSEVLLNKESKNILGK
ncbi:hypothetical protein [Flavobacterium ovatum]|uniref:hypothetical protein n=1 Tax=Flavobacterium ovatum TaxID=1928857 RepID=UPI00344DF36A